MINLVWLVPCFPLLGFLLNGVGRRVFPKGVTGIIGCLTVLASFLISCGIFNAVRADGFTAQTVHLFDFISAGSLHLPFDFYVDQLTSLFLLIITGVGFLIHLYSTAYMHEESGEGFARYFAYLNLFVFSMLLLVLGANYVIMFIGWEGVGLCSYLLIGFWFKNADFTKAANKAFIMNRIGDLGFLIALFWMLQQFGTLTFTEVFPKAAGLGMHATVLTGITLLLFVGAAGKSAQIPLYTWLPDAMAGPTPVSALIHAATMVTAGVYMIARSNVLYTLAPATQWVVAVVGVLTAVFAASIALKQNDIKKVLAYSTVSQLGYMFLGLGVGAYTGAVFHVMTHAFFKALLFLGAGSVIHAMGGEQDMRKMGGLRGPMKITYITFLIACLAIAGIPPLSGFFSKDEILGQAFAASPLLYVVGLAGALMTAFYMFRALAMTFHGTFRGTEAQRHHLHESPPAMTLPLIVLALLAIAGGWVGIPEVLGGHHGLSAFLAPVFAPSQPFIVRHEAAHRTELLLMAIATALVIIMILWALRLFNRYKDDGKPFSGFARVLADKWYVDELYDAAVGRPLKSISGMLDRVVEKAGIDGLVNGVGRSVRWGSRQVRMIQTGQVGFYIFAMVVGMVILLVVGIFL
ncbi:NADH-quinone oxidoreductase subunit L [Compostibacter hankyongensis]|uniref:NADH-quinone oxidoreductase subunit L n=1 Tax=Compostibacter hankyongensis TaxID=1007089 RepID=A0ABP8FGQ0_9BACT